MKDEVGSGIPVRSVQWVHLVHFVHTLVRAFFLFAGVLCLAAPAHAACRNPYLAEKEALIRPAASRRVEIKWFGHSFFQITSGAGTVIITDPFYPMGFPMPEVWPHVVTVGREQGNHNNVGLAKGKPLILRGLKEGKDEWDAIHTTFRDVLIYSVPLHQRGVVEYAVSLKGSAFVFELDGLCILHSGDISEPYNEDQLQLIGHVDILLQAIGGVYTIGPEGARQIIERLKPKIVIPMHFWYNTGHLERFIDGPYPAKFLQTNRITVSKETLPRATEILVLKVSREGEI
ncbi:MAG: MBL fold metallo-hydrolase [Deltaproteobacteria bacterium]|nr:MBL fold metallo-hydrolase [Deltaproteobacteria bacterium]